MATGLIGERSGSPRRGPRRGSGPAAARQDRPDPAGLGRPGDTERGRRVRPRPERRLPDPGPRAGVPRGVRSGAPAHGRPGSAGRERSGPAGRDLAAAPPRLRAGTREQVKPGFPATTPAGAQGAGRPARARARSRTPFILLLLGLLGGGMVSLLLINTTLAQGAFQINAMQQKNASLSQRVQALQQQTAQEESPASIAARAGQLGMLPAGRLRFLDLKTGRVYSQPATVPGVIPIPGYVP